MGGSANLEERGRHIPEVTEPADGGYSTATRTVARKACTLGSQKHNHTAP